MNGCSLTDEGSTVDLHAKFVHRPVFDRERKGKAAARVTAQDTVHTPKGLPNIVPRRLYKGEQSEDTRGVRPRHRHLRPLLSPYIPRNAEVVPALEQGF